MLAASKGKTAIFKLDDGGDPGFARVALIKKTRVIMGRQVWRVRILEVIKPSSRACKVGTTLEVAENLLGLEP